jgi:CRISPR-associated protein Cmr2
MDRNKVSQSVQNAIAWCLAWGSQEDFQETYKQLQALGDSNPPNNDLGNIVADVQKLFNLKHPNKNQLLQLINDHPLLWQQKVGLVYGGATKIKQYVFETNKLQEIRGASALLDRINLVDLHAFFDPKSDDPSRTWLVEENAALADALIPDLIVYSTGGNILAFCPAPFVTDLANAIEKRYTQQTLTANSCAVGCVYRPLEIVLGLLPNSLEDLFWFEECQSAFQDPDATKRKFISAYLQPIDDQGILVKNPTEKQLCQAFRSRKSFNELTSQLAILFNQRRSGNDEPDRPSRRYPVMIETQPYLRRDGSEKRLAVLQAKLLPGNPWLSEATAIKYRIGQIAKRDDSNSNWYRQSHLPEIVDDSVKSWVKKFEEYLDKSEKKEIYQAKVPQNKQVNEARSLREIANAGDGYVAYIYADGNNMGGYIQNIKTPQGYKTFSQDIFEATEKSVYIALEAHLRPHELNHITDPENQNRNGQWIHPFEIITIGGDDVMLIVPANQALEIAKTLAETFENILKAMSAYKVESNENLAQVHRYSPDRAQPSQSALSMSAGVLITAENTPIYYAQNLTEQLLKSAKERGKILKKSGYYGGMIDFLVLKSVTMISSNIQEFRKEGLIKRTKTRDGQGNECHQTLKLYAAPYTLHEIGGIVETVQALKATNFPKSQLYQLRSFLERGRRTAMLNYRYFRIRLKQGQPELIHHFEEGWCKAHSNKGNVAPWMYEEEHSQKESTEHSIKVSIYETILRDLVDLYEFIEKDSGTAIEEPTLPFVEVSQ